MVSMDRRETAKIYQFPARGRAGLDARTAAQTAAETPMVAIDVSGSWYHGEAVREAQATRKS